jgi:hypothetical protein
VPVNDTTANRAYQKPNIANTLADDVGRLRSALDAIDTDMASKAPSAGPTFTGVTTVAAGSAAAPSLTFTGATSDTGLYSPGADQVAISTGGTGRLFVDASGNIGVGVEAPTRQIDIAASNTTAGLGYAIRLRANPTAAASAIQWTTSDAGSTNGYIACDTSRAIYLASGSTERMRITLAGTTTITSNASTAPFIANIGASEVARIDSSGSLLVGTSSTNGNDASLQVRNDAVSSTHIQVFRSSDTAAAAPVISVARSRGTAASPTEVTTDDLLGTIAFTGYDGAAWVNGATIQAYADNTWTDGGDTTDAPSRLVFSTAADGAASPTERMVIKADGKVGIGTSSPDGALDVAVGGAGPARIICSQSSDNPYIDFYRSTGIGSNFTGFRQRQILGNFVFENAPSNTIGSHTFTERLRIDSSGRLLVGTSSARDNFFNTGGFGGRLQIEGANATSQRAISNVYGASNTGGPVVVLGKHRSDSIGGVTAVVSGDECGIISFQGSDGTEFVEATRIAAEVDGTPGANDMPGRLVFSTTADGASTPTERLRIANDGRHTINSSAHQGTALSVTAPAKLYTSTGTYTDTATAASGTVTHGPIVAFDNPAIAATNATVTYTNASTVYIDGAPTNGTNVSITNAFALFVAAGASRFGGSVLSSSATAGIGYATGAGGVQTQTTSRTQGVTLNTICGAITLVSAAGSTSWQSFTVTNSTVAATDNVIVNQKSGTDLYMIHVTNVAAGSFRITYATTGGTTTEQPVFNFSVIKAVAA